MNKRKILTISLLLIVLISLSFVGACAATGSGTAEDPYILTPGENIIIGENEFVIWTGNEDDGYSLTIKNPTNNDVYYKFAETITKPVKLADDSGLITISGNNVIVDFGWKGTSGVEFKKNYNYNPPSDNLNNVVNSSEEDFEDDNSINATIGALTVTGGNVTVKNAKIVVTGNVGNSTGLFVRISNGKNTIEDSVFDFSGVENEKNTLQGISLNNNNKSVEGTISLNRCAIYNGNSKSHKSQTIVIYSGNGGILIDGNNVTDVKAGLSGARESVCIRIASHKAGDNNVITIKNTKLESNSENSGNVGIAIDKSGSKSVVEVGAKIVIDSVSFNFPSGGYNIWKEETPNGTVVEFKDSNVTCNSNISNEVPFAVCFADSTGSSKTGATAGKITFTGDSIPGTFNVDVGASLKTDSKFTVTTLKNAIELANSAQISSNLTVYDSITLDENIAIYDKVNFIVSEDAEMKINSGKTLTFPKSSIIKGKIVSEDNTGASFLSANTSGSSLKIEGILDVSKEDTYDKIKGALTVNNGGYLTPRIGSVINCNTSTSISPEITDLENDLGKLFNNAEFGSFINIGGKKYVVIETQKGTGKGTLKLRETSDKLDYLSTESVDFGSVYTDDSSPENIEVYVYETEGATIDFTYIGDNFGYDVSGGIDKATGVLTPAVIGKIIVKSTDVSIPGKYTGKITITFTSGTQVQVIPISINVVQKPSESEEKKVAKVDIPVIDIKTGKDEETGKETTTIVGNATELTVDVANKEATLKKSETSDVSIVIKGDITSVETEESTWVNIPENAEITANYVFKNVDVKESENAGVYETTLKLSKISTELPTLSGAFDSDIAYAVESQNSADAVAMISAKDETKSLDSINQNIDELIIEIKVPKSSISNINKIEVYHVKDTKSGKVSELLKKSEYSVNESGNYYNIRINSKDRGFSSYVVSYNTSTPSPSHSGSTTIKSTYSDGKFTFDRSVIVLEATLPGATEAKIIPSSLSEGYYKFDLNAPGFTGNGTMTFKVPLNVISQKGYTTSDVGLYHQENNEWVLKPTTYLKTEDGNAYYKGTFDSCSPFKIDFEVGATKSSKSSDTTKSEPQKTDTTKTDTTKTDSSSKTQKADTTKTQTKSPFPILGILAGAGLVGFFAVRRY